MLCYCTIVGSPEGIYDDENTFVTEGKGLVLTLPDYHFDVYVYKPSSGGITKTEYLNSKSVKLNTTNETLSAIKMDFKAHEGYAFQLSQPELYSYDGGVKVLKLTPKTQTDDALTLSYAWKTFIGSTHQMTQFYCSNLAMEAVVVIDPDPAPEPETPEALTLTEHLSHCEIINASEFTPGEPYSATLVTTGDYYFFQTAPYALMDGVRIDGEISNDVFATIEIDAVTADVDLYAEAEYLESPKTKAQVEQVFGEGASSSFMDSEVNIGASLLIDLGTTQGMKFSEAPYAVMDGTQYEAQMLSDTYAQLEIPKVYNDITIYAPTEVHYVTLETDLIACECDQTSGTYVCGTSLTFHVSSPLGLDISETPVALKNGITYPFVPLNTNPTSYTLTLTLDADVIVRARAIIHQSDGNPYGHIQLYTLDGDGLRALANQFYAFYTVSVQNTTQSTVYYPVSDYVLSLQAFHLDIPLETLEYVKVGAFTTKAYGGIPSDYFVHIDCGTVEIPEIYGNALDYSRYTKLTISLPFCGQASLDTDRYMGQTVTLTYDINLVNGDCTATLSNAAGVEETFTGKASFQVPVKNYATYQSVEANTQYMMNFKPRIIGATSKPLEDGLEADTAFGKKCDFIAVLGDLTGYTESDNVHLVTNEMMLLNDIQDIKAKIEGGIVI